MRSSRAISASCNELGMDSVSSRPSNANSAPVSRNWPDSSKPLVSSSTNKGTPSVLAAMSSSKARGKALPWVTRRARLSTDSRPMRESARRSTLARAPMACTKLGLAVTSSNMRSDSVCSSSLSISARVVGSIQCASSRTISKGRRCDMATSCSTKSCMLRSRRWLAVSLSRPWRASATSPSPISPANKARSLAGLPTHFSSSQRSNLSNLAPGESSIAKPAANVSCDTTGCKAVPT